MRLLICDAEQDDVKSALAHLKNATASVLINPNWLTPDPNETLWIACGAPALKMVQAAGWIPKKGGVEANRGRLFRDIQPDGWTHKVDLGVTYAPQIYHIDYADFVHFQTDIALYKRYQDTGSIEPQLGDYRYVDDLSGVIEYLKAKHHATGGGPVELALDTETEGLNPFDDDKRIVCLQASAKPGISDVVYVLNDHVDYQQVTIDGKPRGVWHHTERLERIIGQLQWIASQPWVRIIGANFKYDMLWARVKWGVSFENFAFDTCNGGSLVEENRANTLNLHTKIYSPELGGYDDSFSRSHDKSKMGQVSKEDLLPYAGGDTDACLRNYYEIRREVVADNTTKSGVPAKNSLASVYVNIIQPTLRALHKMEYTGVMVDREKFHEFGADLNARMQETKIAAAKLLPKAILDKAGGLDVNGGAPLSKPKMIADYLFSVHGLNLKPTTTTEKTGAPSTSEYHLAQFKDHPEAGPLIELFLDFKSVSKMHGTYYEGFLEHLRPDDRWHPSYIIHKQGKSKDNEQNAGGTVTGRGSAVDPAFQCVSGDTEIMTSDGVRLARDIIDPIIPKGAYNPFREHKMLVFGSKGFQFTSNVFKSWRNDLMRVTLRCGNSITCTPEHPFFVSMSDGKMGGQWIAAKNLHEGDHLAFPKEVGRPDPLTWITPKFAEALGVILAHGTIKAGYDKAVIEVPQKDFMMVEQGLLSLGGGVSVSHFEEKFAQLELPINEVNLGSLAEEVRQVLRLAKGYQVPPEIRGTTRFMDLLRGFLTAIGVKGTSQRGRPALRIYHKDRDLCVTLARETLLCGIAPPPLNVTETGLYRMEWSGSFAGKLLKLAGMDTTGYKTELLKHAKNDIYPGLIVTSIDAAGSGYVYDFTVPSTHDFIANGHLVHNTVPKHSYWGKRLRECIIAPPGYKILGRDYSQGELKVAACWAGEAKMIDAYLNGIDLHTLTAATVNGMSYEEAMHMKAIDEAAYKVLRQNGKAGNFGLLYGMQAYGFMMYADAVYGVKLTLEEAEAMRDAYFDLYPGLPIWHTNQINEAIQTGMVRSPLGRLRHLPNINSPIKATRKKAQNQAINSPIQGTLVDMMWWSMGIIEDERPELMLPCGQIHDQGLWYVREEDEQEAIDYSASVMEHLPFKEKFGWEPALVFTSDAEVGYDLANLKEVA